MFERIIRFLSFIYQRLRGIFISLTVGLFSFLSWGAGKMANTWTFWSSSFIVILLTSWLTGIVYIEFNLPGNRQCVIVDARVYDIDDEVNIVLSEGIWDLIDENNSIDVAIASFKWVIHHTDTNDPRHQIAQHNLDCVLSASKVGGESHAIRELVTVYAASVAAFERNRAPQTLTNQDQEILPLGNRFWDEPVDSSKRWIIEDPCDEKQRVAVEICYVVKMSVEMAPMYDSAYLILFLKSTSIRYISGKIVPKGFYIRRLSHPMTITVRLPQYGEYYYKIDAAPLSDTISLRENRIPTLIGSVDPNFRF
ncbi:hypothetical protein KFU94_01535 [Chloroflexi bacterium TSY]|nr:hypothetical protein [Chloroflexi bacterium TSY]